MAHNASQIDLTSDGICYDFFNLLWTKDDLNFSPSINIPDTVIIKHGQPICWYFTSTNGRIKKKNRQNLLNARIEESFTRHLLGYDVLATFISVANEDQAENKGEGEAFNKKTQLQFLDHEALNQFLYKSGRNNNGILQKFIEPKGVKNEAIRIIWSPKVCLLERCENINQLHDKRFGIYERCVTFEGPEYYSKSTPLRGPVLAGQLQKVCEAIVSHISGFPPFFSCFSCRFFPISPPPLFQRLPMPNSVYQGLS